MNRTGPPQPLRNVNNVFQNQQNANTRPPSLTSSRLQNGKFESSMQSKATERVTDGICYSDFPSLSGAPQSQQAIASQNVWGGSNIRNANTNPPVQRPTGQTSQNNAQAPGPPQSQQLGAESENARPMPFDGLNSSLDSHRYDEYGGANRDISRGGQQGTTDEFPPLGGLGRPDIRQGGSQGSHLQGLGAASAYMSGQATRATGFGGDVQTDGLAPNGVVGHVVSPSDGPHPSRSPLDGQEDLNGNQRHLPNPNARIPPTNADTFSLPHRSARPPNSASELSSRYPSGEQPAPSQPPTETQNGASTTPSDTQAPNGTSPVTDLDRYGLKGFLSELHNLNPDQTAVRLGMDLNQLGLDLNRQGPLHTDWAGPFADQNTRPVVPHFQLPTAYTVQNVPPLEEKLPSFSDETLFTIFYSMPRDKAQELAANELYSRDWRWHKRMQQWMMKAKEFGEPVQLPSQKEERGWYYFFDLQNWKRERKEFILNYEHLYHPSERLGIGGTL
ncbi:MAG: hypothetical protein Q9159_006961 [Coniocarpon cinnabarinum]